MTFLVKFSCSCLTVIAGKCARADVQMQAKSEIPPVSSLQLLMQLSDELIRLCCWCSMPHKRLSEPFRVLRLDLQRRLDEASVPGLKETSTTRGNWERDETLSVGVSAPGCCNAIAFWFEVRQSRKILEKGFSRRCTDSVCTCTLVRQLSLHC